MADFWQRRDEVGPHKFNPLPWGGACRWLVTPLLSLMLVVGKGWWGNLGQWDSWDLSPLILSLPSAKTGDLSPKLATQREDRRCSHASTAQWHQHPQCEVLGRTISRAYLLDVLISIIVFKASVHPGQS